MRHVTVITTAIALSIAAAGPSAISAAEQQLNPKAISIKLPDQIAWKRNAAGTNETALLYGDPLRRCQGHRNLAADGRRRSGHLDAGIDPAARPLGDCPGLERASLC